MDFDSTRLKNSTYSILREFIINQQDDDDPLYDVYVTQDYDETVKAFEMANEGDIDRKPVIHFFLIEPNTGNKTYSNNDTKIQRIYMLYNVFVVIDSKVEEDKKRRVVLNDLSDKLKVKFDRYGYLLEDFMQISMNVADKPLGENSENLYATQQTLEFRIDKKV
ncbi:MAG: hypothetical protein ACOC1X_00195 [Promethearchaeota archaeon]